MPEQYFEANPQSPNSIKTLTVQFQGQDYAFETDAGVFSRDALDEGTELLLETLLPRLSGRVLDLGCGWGPVGVITAKSKPETQVVMSDINERAANLSRRNLEKNQVSAQVFCADGLDSLPGLFDWILLNPPIRAGKQAVYRLYAQSASRLTPGGKLAIVIRKQQGAQTARAYLETLFDTVELIGRRKGYHIYCCGRSEHEVRPGIL